MSEDLNETTSYDEEVENDLPEADLAALLNVQDYVEKWVRIPEWGMKVRIKSLSKNEQIRLRKLATTNGRLDNNKLEGLILVEGMVSPKITQDHVSQLFNKNSGAVDKILSAILDVSGAMNADTAEADFQG